MIGWHSQIGVASTASSGTTLSATLTAGASVGDLVVLYLTADRNNDVNSSINTGGTAISASDSRGNTWNFGTPRAEANIATSRGANDADTAVAVAWSVLTTALQTNDTVTLTVPSSPTAFDKVLLVQRFVHESTSGGVVASSISPSGATGNNATSFSAALSHTSQTKHSLVIATLLNLNSYNTGTITLTNYARLGQQDSGANLSYSQRGTAYAGILAPAVTSRAVNPSWSNSSEGGVVYQVLQEANPPAAWWDTSGTSRAADRFTTDNAIFRFRQETENAGLSYTVPDLSLISRRLNGNGLSLDSTSGAGNYVVTPSTKPNRYRMRVKLPSSSPGNLNMWALVFRQSGTTFWRAGVKFNASGAADVKIYRYSAANTIASNTQLAAAVLTLGSTYDIEVRDDGSVISVWYKLDTDSVWTQAGSNQSNSTYGTNAGSGVAISHESGNSSSATSVAGGILRWEAFTASTGNSGSGTLTAPAQTLTGTGALRYQGSGTLSAALQTLSGNGLLVFQGSGSLSPPLHTLAGTGSVTAYVGAGPLSPPSHTLTGSGVFAAVFSGSGTLSAALQTLSGNGLQIFSGAGTITALAQTLIGTGQIVFTGDGALAVPTQILSGNGVFTGSITGNGTITAPAQVLSGSALLVYSGSGAISPPNQTLAGTGTIANTYAGAGTISPPNQTLTGSALLVYSGSGAITAPAQTLVGAGLYSDGLSGFGTLTAPAHILTGVGTFAELFTGSGSLVAPAQTLSGNAVLVYIGSGTISPPPMTLTGSGQLVFAGSGTLSAASHTLSGVGVFNRNIGSGTLTATAQTLTGTGALRYQGSGTLAPPTQTLNGSGAVPIAGTGTLTNRNQTLTGTAGLSNFYQGSGNLTSPAHTLTGVGQLGNFSGYFPNPGTGTWLGYFQTANGSWVSAFTSTTTDWEDYFD